MNRSEFELWSLVDNLILTGAVYLPNQKSSRNIRRAKVCRFLLANKTGDFDPVTGSFDESSSIWNLINDKADVFTR